METKWVFTKYGEAPFAEVKVVSFSCSGPKTRDDTAFVQYNLLLNDNILQLHLDHASKKGVAVITDTFSIASELKKVGLVCSNFSEKKMKYEELLAKNNLF